jgi:hypothetical protein
MNSLVRKPSGCAPSRSANLSRRTSTHRNRWAFFHGMTDSPLGERGFEPSVPLYGELGALGRASRTRAFPAGVRGSLDEGVSRDAAGFPLRANRRQCLCRAIFQYRSEADAVSGNATTVRTKSGVSGL